MNGLFAKSLISVAEAVRTILALGIVSIFKGLSEVEWRTTLSVVILNVAAVTVFQRLSKLIFDILLEKTQDCGN